MLVPLPHVPMTHRVIGNNNLSSCHIYLPKAHVKTPPHALGYNKNAQTLASRQQRRCTVPECKFSCARVCHSVLSRHTHKMLLYYGSVLSCLFLVVVASTSASESSQGDKRLPRALTPARPRPFYGNYARNGGGGGLYNPAMIRGAFGRNAHYGGRSSLRLNRFPQARVIPTASYGNAWTSPPVVSYQHYERQRAAMAAAAANAARLEANITARSGLDEEQQQNEEDTTPPNWADLAARSLANAFIPNDECMVQQQQQQKRQKAAVRPSPLGYRYDDAERAADDGEAETAKPVTMLHFFLALIDADNPLIMAGIDTYVKVSRIWGCVDLALRGRLDSGLELLG